MDSTTTPSNESILSAEDIHRDNLTAFSVGNKARFLLNRGLLALYETGLYRALDYPSIIKYADVNFGFSPSQTYESLRVADALRTLPRLTEAFKEGKTFWSAVRDCVFPPQSPQGDGKLGSPSPGQRRPGSTGR